MDWKQRNVLVTGAGGFIGSHLTETLVKAGASVRAFVRYSSRGDLGFIGSFSPEVREKIEVVFGDLTDPQAVSNAVRGMDVVFHLGALIAIPYSYVNPVHVVQTNVLGTTYILEAVRQHQVGYTINISTSEVYGTAQYVPIDENHPLQGQSPYSASKIGAEKIAESYYRSFGTPVATLRPFNTYGPRQSARAVIPSIITQALTRDEIHLGSLTPTRDLNFVLDTVDGMMHAVGEEGLLGRSTNIGTGTEISVGDLASKIVTMIGRDVRVVQDTERLRPTKSEVERLLADSRMMRQVTGWSSKISLDEGLARTIEWIKGNIALYRPKEYAV
ncbi:MAG: GDP-mannose 4,6-dehydratase [Chloroflexi bacterium]|nr:GDP-mannose 4,6-dehydratase [Chloroflexota bacterium]MCC6895641.1 GDP-mannose 4,6-dehydratase [Anaerolineae bacterium]